VFSELTAADDYQTLRHRQVLSAVNLGCIYKFFFVEPTLGKRQL
jgi:hypothetical protein